ncbi:MAG: tetratricopeptide repeat protein [Sedimentisphaerales bacterium]
MKKNTKIIIMFIAVSLIMAANCQGGHKQKKQEMRAKWQKTSSEMRLSVAAEQVESGQYEQAEAAARESIACGQGLADAYLILGKCCLAKGDLPQAKDCFEKHVRFDDKNAEGWFLLGLACERLGDNNFAFKWYKKALEFSPNDADYVIALGRIYIAQGEFVSAEKLYQQQIAAKPSDTNLKIAAAQMYLECGQNDRAVGLYEQAQMLAPENNELLEALGSCYVIAGNWHKAGEIHGWLYQRCTDETAKNRYLQIMAHCATQAGDYKSAMKYYSQLTVQDKNDASLWLSMAQAALGADLPRQAIIYSKKALTLKPDMAQAYLISGSAHYKNSEYKQAIDDFRKAIDGSADAQFGWLMTARCYERIGNAERAKAAYEKASQFQTDSELQKLLVKSNQGN